jgi:hypothetical protein
VAVEPGKWNILEPEDPKSEVNVENQVKVGDGTAVFDFSNPDSLNVSRNDNITDYGLWYTTHMNTEDLINQYTFTDGPVTISFSNRGNGAAVALSAQGYTLSIRGHGEMVINLKSKGCYLRSVKFD